jgi:hypothetical protein
MLLLIDHHYPDLLIRSVWHKSGKIDAAIRDIRDSLCRVLAQNGFSCHSVATDGANGVEGQHEHAYQKYASLGETDLESVISSLTNSGQDDFVEWPVSDPLHPMKNARSRLALGSLAFNAETDQVIIARSISAGLPPSSAHAFDARKPLDLLKDDLAIQAFTIDNLFAVWKAGNVPGTYFLFPFITLSTAVRSLGLCADTGPHLIQAAFSGFFRMIQNYPECGREFHISEKTIQGCNRKTFWTKSMCRRACNTCIGRDWAIQMSPRLENAGVLLALNRIGSHSGECHFGMTRSTLNGETP